MHWLTWKSSAHLSQMEPRLCLIAVAEAIRMFRQLSSTCRFNGFLISLSEPKGHQVRVLLVHFRQKFPLYCLFFSSNEFFLQKIKNKKGKNKK